MEKEIKEMCEKFAKKYQYDIISIGEFSANFKEYDGDGYFKRKYTFLDILDNLADLPVPH